MGKVYFLHRNGCLGVLELYTENGGQREWVTRGCGGELQTFSDTDGALSWVTKKGGSLKMGTD